jgi:hypothetical protein
MPEHQPSAASPSKPARQPALLYVLAAFGIIAGGYGSINSVTSAAMLLKPPEEFAKLIVEHNELWQPQLPKAELDRQSAREAEAAYGRRKAALPLAAVGLIVSCLLFAGCIRSMMGDRSGASLWSLAALASIPYQMLAMALSLLTLRDFARTLDAVPEGLRLVRMGIVISSALAIGYYASCLVYLRARERMLVSDGAGRTPPSA